MDRRQFLASSLVLLAPRSSSAATARIDILPDEPIGTISPNIYGHFTEHLGGCIYDGVWVGENSKVPNIGGVRKSLVESLKRIKAPVIRWPGGCFADSYNWRDGVGPRERRPKRTNFWANNPYLEKAPNGPQKYDPNQFGTNEFARFCRLSGAEPYFAGNVRSLTPNDFYEWIEYCNSPKGTTSMAELREQGGSADPLNVKFWGVGNESWGCGGAFTGDEYAIEFRKFVEWVPLFEGGRLSYIASGPNGADYNWTRSFFTKMVEHGPGPLRNIFGVALHYYCGTTGNGDANVFTTEEWYELLAKASRMEELITSHWSIMGETDREHRVKLVVDEWGAWHHTDPNIDPSYLWAYFPTLRDALVSGITLDTFNRHADKVTMANAAQLINNIHTSFVALGDKFTVTPVYHVFDLYAAHMGGTSVRTLFSAARAGSGKNSVAGLSGSCSLHSNRAVLTVVNTDAQNVQESEISIMGRKISSGKGRVLTASDTHARNTFDQPKALEPAAAVSLQAGSPTVYKFPPASVTCLELELT